MSDIDKTITIENNSDKPDYGKCPVCSNALQPDWNDMELLRCPVCRYVRKTPVIVAPGQIVGHKYRILSYLNGGGCGSIFLCYPLDDPAVRLVLKVLIKPTAVGRKRFRREAEILSSVTGNSRIAKIIDYWEAGGDTYIVMEYVEGKNLKELARCCCFDELSILQIAYEVARALQDIWNGFSIIHRDIKPENIMLDNEYHLKLLDFGLSKQCDCEDGSLMITMANSVLGTPGYMSPEHFTDFKSMDFRSDIYSLGATLLFLLGSKSCNKENCTMMDLYRATLQNSPPPEECFAGKCSVGCMNMIRRMMQQKVEDRYNSYEELIDEINTLLSSY